MITASPRKSRGSLMAKTTAKAVAKPAVKPAAKGGAKSAAKSAAAHLASAATPASGVASQIDEVASTWVGSRRRNAQALLEAGQQSYAGVAEVLKRRLAILQDTVAELRTVAQVMRRAGARESVAHLDGLARGAVQLSLNSIRELSALASATQKEALDILARRLRDDLAEFRQLRSKRTSAPAKPLARSSSK